MSERIPKEIQSLYRVSEDQLRTEARVTKKVRLKDGTTAYEVPVIEWGAGRNPGVMLAPFKKQLKNVDRVAIQLKSENPLEIVIKKSERGHGRPKS